MPSIADAHYLRNIASNINKNDFEALFLNKIGMVTMRSAVYFAQRGTIFGADVAASIRENFATNLKLLLAKHSLKQNKFASDIGVDPSIVSNWVRGKNFPEEASFDRIKAKYGWTYDALVKDPGTMSAQELIDAIKQFAKTAGYEFYKKS